MLKKLKLLSFPFRRSSRQALSSPNNPLKFRLQYCFFQPWRCLSQMLSIFKNKTPGFKGRSCVPRRRCFVIVCFPKQKEKWLTHWCGQSGDGRKKRNSGVLLFKKRFHFYVHFCRQTAKAKCCCDSAALGSNQTYYRKAIITQKKLLHVYRKPEIKKTWTAHTLC